MIGNLTVLEIIDAFPDESSTIAKRELRRLKKELKFWFDWAKSIRNNPLYPYDWKIFYLGVIDIFKPREKFRQYRLLQRIINTIENKSDNRVSDEKIIYARNIPIRLLNNWNVNNRNKFVAVCPFHSDNGPSFSVTGNLYHCFGCGASGDSIDFIKRLYGYNFVQAINFLNTI